MLNMKYVLYLFILLSKHLETLLIYIGKPRRILNFPLPTYIKYVRIYIGGLNLICKRII